MRQTSQQLAGIRQAQADIRASQDLLLVRTGQILEASRMKPTAPSGRMTWREAWATTKEYLSGFVLLHKVWSAWRAISWPVNVGFWASVGAKWLGFL